jgi:hypothetical protein
MCSPALRTAASVRQQHLSNGSVLLSFDAVLHAPRAGEAGTLQAASTDGSAWAAQQRVTLAQAGENVVAVQVTALLLSRIKDPSPRATI